MSLLLLPHLRGLYATNVAAMGGGPNWAWRDSDLSLAPYRGSGTPTVARALNTATRINSSGLVETVNADLPRFDYSLAGVLQGLLVEGAATNIALRNRDLTNIAWVKGATATVAKDQTGADGAANGASSLTGGAVAATNTCFQTVVLASSIRVFSAYVKRVTGTGAVYITNDGMGTSTDIGASLTSSYQRFSITTTLANPTFGFRVDTNGDKIAVDFSQNETGILSSATTATAGSAVTRNADDITLATSGISGFSANPGSVYIRVISQTGSAFIFNTPFGLYTDANNALSFYRNQGTTDIRATMTTASVGQADFSIGTDAGAATEKLMMAYGTNDVAAVKDGGTVGADAAATIPAQATMVLGNAQSGNALGYWYGWIKDVELYNFRVHNDVMDAKTT